MKKGLLFWERLVALATIFFLPSQFAFHFWPNYAFVFGARIDYLSPAVYFSDVLIISLLVFVLRNAKPEFVRFLKSKSKLIVLLVTFSIINTAFSVVPAVSAFKWLKIFEALFFASYIFIRKKDIGEVHILGSLFASAFLVSLIGITQFFSGGTTGLFYLLGERSFRISTPGIALVSLGGREFMRAYSVFPHPNVLAGYLGLTLITLVNTKRLHPKAFFLVGLLLISFCLFLTFSLSAFVAIGCIVALFLFKGKKIFRILSLSVFAASLLFSLLMPVLSREMKGINFSQNVSQRFDLAEISVFALEDAFVLGRGLNTYIINSAPFERFVDSPWLLQPVHNIFLLAFSEIGITGLLFLALFSYSLLKTSLRKKNFILAACLLFILIVGTLDHYWITLQQGLLSLSFFIGFNFWEG